MDFACLGRVVDLLFQVLFFYGGDFLSAQNSMCMVVLSRLWKCGVLSRVEKGISYKCLGIVKFIIILLVVSGV